MRNTLKDYSQVIIVLIFASFALWGAGRLYFMLTDGFMESNVRYNLDLPLIEGKRVTELDQPYHYLAKGCQAYVFLSEDGQSVLKLFKFKRFHEPLFLNYFDWIPAVDRYLVAKRKQKHEALTFALQAWHVAYDKLPKESGLLYVHVNPTTNLQQKIVFYDKIGLKHVFEADNTVFMLQHRAEMMVPWIDQKMTAGDIVSVQAFLRDLIFMLQGEYLKGVNDADLALMQNTGVYEGHPFHIDVGQFYLDETNWQEELFLKTYELRDWLKTHYPPLEEYVTGLLKELIGPEFSSMKYYARPGKAHL